MREIKTGLLALAIAIISAGVDLIKTNIEIAIVLIVLGVIVLGLYVHLLERQIIERVRA